jgi:hypothetical protein
MTAARLSSHHEACELYRRVLDNMPPNLDPAEQGALFEAYGVEAAASELHQAAQEAAALARDRYVEAGRPIDAARQLNALAGLARREAHPIQARSTLIARGLAELESLPATPEREAAQLRGEVVTSAPPMTVAVIAAATTTARSANGGVTVPVPPAGRLTISMLVPPLSARVSAQPPMDGASRVSREASSVNLLTGSSGRTDATNRATYCAQRSVTPVELAESQARPAARGTRPGLV